MYSTRYRFFLHKNTIRLKKIKIQFQLKTFQSQFIVDKASLDFGSSKCGRCKTKFKEIVHSSRLLFGKKQKKNHTDRWNSFNFPVNLQISL